MLLWQCLFEKTTFSAAPKRTWAQGLQETPRVRCKLRRFSPIIYKFPQCIGYFKCYISRTPYSNLPRLWQRWVLGFDQFMPPPEIAPYMVLDGKIHAEESDARATALWVTAHHDTVRGTRMLTPRRQLYLPAYSSYRFKEHRGNVSVCWFIQPFHSKTKITKKGS